MRALSLVSVLAISIKQRIPAGQSTMCGRQA
jgi:hypothetical protein